MKATDFTGTMALVRFRLRLDRVSLPVWIIVLVSMLAGTISSYTSMYDTGKVLRELAAMVNNTPSLLALSGPVFAANLGSLVVYKMGALGLAMIGLMALLTVIRHTRGEEAEGRYDLLGASVVGRYAPLTAGLVVSFGGSMAIGLLFALTMVGMGLPAMGSVVYGASWALVGCLFAAIAGVAAQLTEGAGAAKGLAGGILGLAYVLRAVGDVGGDLEWLSWVSPIGWAQRMRPFADEQLWFILLFITFITGTTLMGYLLTAGRDIGAGVLRGKPGPAMASPALRSPWVLALRLNRPALAWWAVAFSITGAMFGNMASSLGDMAFDNPQLRDALTKLGGHGAMEDALLFGMMFIFGFIASLHAVQVVHVLYSEEESQRIGLVLGAPIGRLGLAFSHLSVALVGPAVVLAAMAVPMGYAYGAGQGNAGHQVLRCLEAAMVQMPAIWIVVALAVLILGTAPRLMGVSWVPPITFLLMGQMGELFGLSKAVMNTSPWTHLPMFWVPGTRVEAMPLVWLTLIAFALLVIGLMGYRHRDIK